MLIQNASIAAIDQAMERLLENGQRTAARVQRFSEVAALATPDSAGLTQQAQQTELSADLARLAGDVARFGALGRMASLQLGLYAVVANGGRG